MNNTDNYFKNFFNETEKIEPYYNEFNIKDTVHIITLDKQDILETIYKFSLDNKKQIQNKFIEIDFKNGNINHFIKYVLNGYYTLILED